MSSQWMCSGLSRFSRPFLFVLALSILSSHVNDNILIHCLKPIFLLNFYTVFPYLLRFVCPSFRGDETFPWCRLIIISMSRSLSTLFGHQLECWLIPFISSPVISSSNFLTSLIPCGISKSLLDFPITVTGVSVLEFELVYLPSLAC